jgi:hypothetical protein
VTDFESIVSTLDFIGKAPATPQFDLGLMLGQLSSGLGLR